MSVFIPDEKIQEIRDSLNIVELIGDYITLKKAGKNYQGLCPFHQEKTPSFNVSPEKQIFHCFGCGKGGDAIRFLMEYENLGFHEALVTLAKRQGIKLPAKSRASTSETKLTEQLHQILEIAANFFINNLKKADSFVQSYLKKRKLNDEAINNFQLGYAPQEWDKLLSYCRNLNLNIELALQAGLIAKSEKTGNFYDIFRHRLIFPIHHSSGKIVAFGARALDPEEKAKYLNSPETAVFQKSYILYGLYQAKKHIRESRYAVLVEGYMDVISLHQNGFPYAVAPMGTALTPQQAKLLSRYGSTVYIAFDGDQAGKNATLRAIPILLKEKIDIRIVCFSEQDDPDAFIIREGKEGFQQLLDKSLPLFDFLIEHHAREKDLRTIDGKAQFIKDLLPYLQEINDPIKMPLIRTKMADFLNIDEQTLSSHIHKSHFVKIRPYQHFKMESKIDKAEKGVLYCFIEFPDTRSEIKASLSPETFLNPQHQKISNLIWELDHIEGFRNSQDLLILVDDEEIRSFVSMIVVQPVSLVDMRLQLKDWLNVIQVNLLRQRKTELERKLKTDDHDQEYLLKEIQGIKKEILNFTHQN